MRLCSLTNLGPGLLVAWQEKAPVVASLDEGVGRIAVGLNPGKANLEMVVELHSYGWGALETNVSSFIFL